ADAVNRKAITPTAIQATPRMAFNRLPSFFSMSRRALLGGAVVLLVAAVAATVVLLTRSSSTRPVERASPPPARRRHVRHRPAQPQPLSLPATLPRRTIALPILMYHRIGRIGPNLAPITRRLTVAPDDFAAQMRWLKRNGFHAVSQQQAFDALER